MDLAGIKVPDTALVRDAMPGPVDEQLINLPRHRIAQLPERIARSVARLPALGPAEAGGDAGQRTGGQ